MDSLHIGFLLCSMWKIGWDDVVGCRDSQRIDLDLHILHFGCRTSAHIDDLHTFYYYVRFAHGFTDHCSTWLHLSGRILGIFVNSLSLRGSRLLCDFLLYEIAHHDALSFFMLYRQSFIVCSPCSWQMSQKHFVWTNQTSCWLMSYRQLSLACPAVEHFVHHTSWFLRFSSFNDFCMISSCSSSLVSVGYAGKSSSISTCKDLVSASSYVLNVSNLMCHQIFSDRLERNH